MGETGVGKTSLVELLAQLMDASFKKLSLHAGVESKKVGKIVKEAQAEANANPLKKIVLFFDEINTSPLVDGMLKEILIDRHFKGVKLLPNISIVAACNPY